MRLVGQMRGGYYPAPQEAITLAASLLRPPRNEPISIVDPCAGEGLAIRQLGALLGCAAQATYAIELDDGRAAALLTHHADHRMMRAQVVIGQMVGQTALHLIPL